MFEGGRERPVGRSGSVKKQNFEFAMAPGEQSTINTEAAKMLSKCAKMRPKALFASKPSKKRI